MLLKKMFNGSLRLGMKYGRRTQGGFFGSREAYHLQVGVWSFATTSELRVRHRPEALKEEAT